MTRPASLLCLLLLAVACVPGTCASSHALDRPLRDLVDAEIQAGWLRQKITPAPKADDAAFLRRIYLDLAGTLPSHDEARQFLQDKDPHKRDKLIDRLLADPRFAAEQAYVWDQVLFGRNPSNGDATRKRDSFKNWLTDQFAKNEPYDHWVRDLLLAEQDGAELFLVQYRNQPEDATVAITRLFLGTQLQCARCHDHPFETWTQRDFFGMAGFLVRLVVVDDATSPMNKRRFRVAEKSTGEVLFTGAVKDQKPGKKGEPIQPKFLGGPALEEPTLPKDFKEADLKNPRALPKPVFSRKEKLAAWVASADNPYFAHAVANRVWAQFMGRGLVHPVDDLGTKSEASHPELLKALTAQIVTHKFDLKWLIRELVSSQSYQLACTGPGTAALPSWFERARVRPLSAEELLASIRVASGFDVALGKAGQTRLTNTGTEEYFVRNLGEPTNGQGEFQGSLTEHLFLNHSDQLRGLIRRYKGNLADVILTSTEPWEKRVDRLFLSILTRLPRPEEQKRFVIHLSADAKATEALVEEAIWVLLNCAEFRFNH